MKFTCTVDIDLPRKEVIALWENPENLAQWQDGFQYMEHISGEKGKAGAKSKMAYIMNGKEMILEETIVSSNLPIDFTGYYKSDKTENTMENYFTELSENQTRWEANIHYTLMEGFILKLILKLFPSMFQKQTQKWMDQFKVFAERNA